MAQTFTLLNNGNSAYNITLFTFTTPSGLTHRANLSNFGGSSTFSGTSYICFTAMAPGQSRTFDLEYNYVSGPADTRIGSVTIGTDSAASTTLSTTVRINGGGVITTTVDLQGQGTYSAVKTSATNPTSSITLTLRPNGTLNITSIEGDNFDGTWITPGPIEGIGNNYWVRFTRTFELGVRNYNSSPTSGWLKLDVNRQILVTATGASSGAGSALETGYVVEVSNSSTGTPILGSGTYLLDVTSIKSGSVNSFGNITVESYFGEFFYEFTLSGSASITFNTDGRIIETVNRSVYLTDRVVGYWYINATSTTGNAYYIRAINTCGQSPVNLNTWYSLSSNRTWGLGAGPGSPSSGQILVEIATAPSSSNIILTGYVNLLAAEFSSEVVACEFPGTVFNYVVTNPNIDIQPIKSTSVVLDSSQSYIESSGA